MIDIATILNGLIIGIASATIFVGGGIVENYLKDTKAFKLDLLKAGKLYLLTFLAGFAFSTGYIPDQYMDQILSLLGVGGAGIILKNLWNGTKSKYDEGKKAAAQMLGNTPD